MRNVGHINPNLHHIVPLNTRAFQYPIKMRQNPSGLFLKSIALWQALFRDGQNARHPDLPTHGNRL